MFELNISSLLIGIFAVTAIACKSRSGMLLADDMIQSSASHTTQNGLNTFTHTYAGMSSYYRLRSPSTPHMKKRPLLVFFHGNLGSNFGPSSIDPKRILVSPSDSNDSVQKLPTLDQILLEEESSIFWQNFVLLAILVPTDSQRVHKSGGKVITWGSTSSPLSKLPNEQLDVHGAFANDLIEKIVDQHNVDRSQVYLVGQSGGGLFLTNTFIPKYATQYAGGAILLCGAEPVRPILRSQLKAEFAERFHLHFHTTENESEHIKPLLEEAFKDYTQLWSKTGRSPSLAVDGAGKHCRFASGTQPMIIRRTIEEWRSVDLSR